MEQEGLMDIGLSKSQKEFLYSRVLRAPVGFILVAAPPGEGGRTTSLFLLSEFDRLTPNQKIITLENPRRCDLRSASKFKTTPDKSYIYYFDHIVFRRPEVVYVDSMPNKEIASKVLESRHFFKLVISNFEAGSVYELITKLAAMNFSKYELREALDLVVSQRLIKKLCHTCVKLFDPLEEEIPNLRQHIKNLGWVGEINFSRASGKDVYGNICGSCQGSGYNGKVAVFEIFKFSIRLRELVFSGASRDQLELQAEKEGFQSLWYSGLEKVLNQETTLEELVGVLGYPRELVSLKDEDFDEGFDSTPEKIN